MICLENVKRLCKEYWLIENYQEAVNDTTQPWDCHHRYEIDYNMSALELQAMGFYFNRPFCELIFLTHGEHSRLHNTGENNAWYGKVGPNKGKKASEETRQKLSDSHKGKPSNRKGKKASEETILKQTKFFITKDELYDLYIVQGLSQPKIAKIYGCSQVCIGEKLKKYNIKK